MTKNPQKMPHSSEFLGSVFIRQLPPLVLLCGLVLSDVFWAKGHAAHHV
jgi:hypothetical protein